MGIAVDLGEHDLHLVHLVFGQYALQLRIFQDAIERIGGLFAAVLFLVGGAAIATLFVDDPAIISAAASIFSSSASCS
ncbi:MAG: hypothetical protein HC782_00910 [Gammaproteobacteria bacterium]|nr:hypothetical protein [Gammaproteobacteria bacterium]